MNSRNNQHTQIRGIKIFEEGDIGEKNFHDYEYPKVSIIIPTYNCDESISDTIDSVLNQNYPDYEVIIVDAESTDRTIDVIKRYPMEKIRIYTVSQVQFVEMSNKGSSLATGYYLNFLFPGDFYLSVDTIKEVMTLALDHNYPDLIYGGTIMRDGKREPHILYRPLSVPLLRRGHQPTSIQSCWVRSDCYAEVGKLDCSYERRGTFEFLCRFMRDPSRQVISTPRVLTDNYNRQVTWDFLLTHFIESMRVIYQYYGIAALIVWFFHQKHLWSIFKMWLRAVRIAFFGR